MDEETGWNAFELRMFEPVIGRWMATDPYGQFYSPYLGMGNNPVSGVDPDGGYSYLGAKLRNFLQGGNGVYKSGDEWGFNVPDGTFEMIGGEMVEGFTSNFGTPKFAEIFDGSAAGMKLNDQVRRQLANNEILRYDLGIRNGIEFDAFGQFSLGLFAYGGIVSKGVVSSAFSTVATNVDAATTFMYIKTNTQWVAFASSGLVGIQKLSSRYYHSQSAVSLRITYPSIRNTMYRLNRSVLNLSMPERGVHPNLLPTQSYSPISFSYWRELYNRTPE